jgi:glycosyltransferase involved in cell wall biosynthesis
MKILHICLASAFTEGMTYQENFLSTENSKAGHEVTIISDCYKYENGRKIPTDPEEKTLEDGTRLIRLKYDKVLNDFISNKVRKITNLYNEIMKIQPDVIMLHNLSGWETISVARYKKNNPRIRLYGDSHTDRNNSGSNWISLNVLHKFFYKSIIKRSLKFFDKVFYISFEGKDFLMDIYNIPEDILEFYPLGGTIISEEAKRNYRKEKREELGIHENDILLCHSGKMDIKKRTYEIIYNFSRVQNNNIKLILIGVFSDDVERKVSSLIDKDSRIIYLGWQGSDELIKYLAASDLYMQPGSQSATMQNALCTGTPVLFENVRSHEPYKAGNAFAINSCSEMESILKEISNNPKVLNYMSEKAYVLARKLLDYKKLAERITK